MYIDVGLEAYDFNLLDNNGKMVKLSDFRGRMVVLYFYPKDNTPGCSTQALGYKEGYNELLNRNVVLLGISKDSINSHNKFICKYNLPFTLLSDPNIDAITKYGVWQEKKLYGKVNMGVVRTTYIIDPFGKVYHIIKKPNTKTDYLDVLKIVDNYGK